MFEFLFKYPPAVFSQGQFLFLSRWPVWVLGLLLVAVAALIAWRIYATRSDRRRVGVGKSIAIGFLQFLFAALVLTVLWRPALSVSALQEKQNAIAVLVDTSRSMALNDIGEPRIEAVKKALSSDAWRNLTSRYQVRLFSVGDTLQRQGNGTTLSAAGATTQLADQIVGTLDQERGVPMGAVVLISDGSENAGGIDSAKLDQIRQRRVPVYTVGVGKETSERDIEMEEVSGPGRSLAKSRVTLYASFTQRGFAGQRARISVRDGEQVLLQRDITLRNDGERQTETLLVRAGDPAIHLLRVSVEPLEAELNKNNNFSTHVLQVSDQKRRILILDGEPRWDFKFTRRALVADEALEVVSAIRTTQNKFYRQGVNGPDQLKDGFPTTVDELFQFDGIVIGSVDVNSLTAAQQNMLREFVDRRGGGILFLAGRESFSETGWQRTPLAELMPTYLPDKKGTFGRDFVSLNLTEAGADSPITRLLDDRAANLKRWAELVPVANSQDLGSPKPGAQTLLEIKGRGPALLTQTFGRGRTAALASAGTWRWQMQYDHADLTHETFWQQMIRWLAGETPGRVQLTLSRPLLRDAGDIEFRAEVRDDNYQLASDATANAEVTLPDGSSQLVRLSADPRTPGSYTGRWTAPAEGSYLAKASAVRGDKISGEDILAFRRENGVAESFRTYQNRDLLERLATATGGRYYPLRDFSRLTEEVTYSDAGISMREARDLWDMPAIFFAAILLRGAEWLLRRRWGVI